MRPRVKALLLCTTCGVLFFLSLALTISAFYISHLISTRPTHVFALPFAHSTSSLSGQVSLAQAPLRSVYSVSTYVHLELPESQVNLDNSVFSVRVQLYAAASNSSTCLAQGVAQAALRFRSPVHRAIRASLLFVPMLLGFVREYQTVGVHVFTYFAHVHSPNLDSVHVQLSPSVLQVAGAKVQLKVRRRWFVTALIMQRQWLGLCLITVGMWYVLLISLIVPIVLLSLLRKLVVSVWNRGAASPAPARSFVSKDKWTVPTSSAQRSRLEGSSLYRLNRVGSEQVGLRRRTIGR